MAPEDQGPAQKIRELLGVKGLEMKRKPRVAVAGDTPSESTLSSEQLTVLRPDRNAAGDSFTMEAP
jgi:hypothetical protein